MYISAILPRGRFKCSLVTHEKVVFIFCTCWIVNYIFRWSSKHSDSKTILRKTVLKDLGIKGHFTHKPRAMTIKLWEPQRKCPNFILRYLQNHVVWSRTLKYGVTQYSFKWEISNELREHKANYYFKNEMKTTGKL